MSSTKINPTRMRRFVGQADSRGQGVGGVCAPLKGATPPTISPGREDVKKVFLQLSKEEQKKLLDEVAADQLLAMSGQPSKARDLAMWAEAVHKALEDVIGTGAVDAPGVGLLKRLLGASAAWGPVDQFMQTSRLQEAPVQERQHIFHTLATLLVARAQQVARHSGAPLGPKLVCNCTINISGIFDAAFPGYVASGLARMVVRSHTQGQA